jgi:hypothetical protein
LNPKKSLAETGFGEKHLWRGERRMPKSSDERMSRRRVTINDLAAELGIAKGTVSRALNGYPDIAEATRCACAAPPSGWATAPWRRPRRSAPGARARWAWC